MRHQCTAVVVVASLLFAACGGGDTTGPADSNGRTMFARIDGAAWNAMAITVDTAPPSLLVVRGENATQSLALVIPMNRGTGLQTIGGPTPLAAGLVMGSQAWVASRTQGGSGSVTLTTVAPSHVAGTFEFTLDGRDVLARRVTSGRFEVKY